MEVRVPDIGDFKDVAVIELLVKAGDTVKLEQSLFTVESDKASMEIPSPGAGAPGAQRSRWAIPSILVIPSPDGSGCGRRTSPRCCGCPAVAPVSAPAPAAAVPSSGCAVAATASVPAPARHALGYCCRTPALGAQVRPRARRAARRSQRSQKGRITQDDVQNFTKVMTGAAQTRARRQGARQQRWRLGRGSEPAARPKVDFTKFGPGAQRNLSRIKKISGANLHRNAGGDPARHQPRRRRHHRPGSLPRAVQTKRTRRAASRSPCWPS